MIAQIIHYFKSLIPAVVMKMKICQVMEIKTFGYEDDQSVYRFSYSALANVQAFSAYIMCC